MAPGRCVTARRGGWGTDDIGYALVGETLSFCRGVAEPFEALDDARRRHSEPVVVRDLYSCIRFCPDAFKPARKLRFTINLSHPQDR